MQVGVAVAEDNAVPVQVVSPLDCCLLHSYRQRDEVKMGFRMMSNKDD